TEREKNLLELYRDAGLLRKLMHLEVSRKEWERVEYRKDWMGLNAIVNRLKKISEELGSELKLDEDSWQKLEKMSGAEEGSLAPILKTSYDFYDFARQREAIFYETIEKTMSEKKTDKAVLVTGGFHTDGLMDLFREHQINASIL